MKKALFQPSQGWMIRFCTLSFSLLTLCAQAQEVQNDATAPLHLMKPAYKIPYGVPSAEDVKATMDRVKNYI